jgi:hypothetical protein
MVSTSKLEMENFNGTNFELWKLETEYLLIDQDEELVVLERKTRILIRLYFIDSVLLIFYEEKLQHLFGRSWGICIRLSPWLINVFLWNKSKSHGRHKSPGMSKEKCWNHSKFEHFRRVWKEEKKKNKRKKMIVKNILKRMVEMSLLRLWKPVHAKVHG